MSNEHEKASEAEDDKFLELALRYQDNTLSREELETLNSELRANPEKQAEFTRICGMGRLVKEANTLPASHRAERSGQIIPLPSRFAWIEHAGFAALLMISLTMTWLYLNRSNESNNAGQPGDRSVARLEHVSDDAVFGSDHGFARSEGSLLPKGWLQLESGTVRIAFDSGAMVEVIGPAVFGIDSAMRGFLDHGRVRVHAPEEARDFIVGAASMEVVDLGTRFEMSVDPASKEAEVNVTEGLVDLHLGGEGTPRRIRSLTAGLTARVDAAGEVISVDGERLNLGVEGSSGLLAHWPLDALGADRVLEDASGLGRNAIFQGDSTEVLGDGKSGAALDLTRGGYIDISEHVPIMTRVNAFTFSAWVRNARDMVFSFSDGTPANRVQFELLGMSLLYGWRSGSSFDHIRGRVPRWGRDRWFHVAVSISGGVVTIYRNGEILSSRASGVKINTKPMSLVDVENPTSAFVGYLHRNHVDKPQRLGGQIDDIQIYRYALDAEAIRFLYENPGVSWKGADTPL